MKQKHLLKSLLLLCALIAGSMNVWAEETTYTFTSAEWAATSGGSSANWTSGKNGAGYNNNGVQVTTAATGANATSPISFSNVTKVVVTFNTNKSTGAGSIVVKIGDNSETSNNVSYSGSADGRSANFTTEFNYLTAQSGNIKLTVNTTTNSIYLCSITITTGGGGGGGSTVATPTFTPAAGTYTTTQSVTIASETDGASIYYTTDGSTPTDESTPYSSAISVSSTTTVKAIAIKDGMTNSSVASSTYTILPVLHAGTAVDPYTVADARNAIDANTGTNDVYVTGIVCEGGSSLASGSMNYWISDDGTETDKFEIYKGKGLSGASFTSTDDVNVGDNVVVFGDITKYNSTYEFSAGSQLISHIKKVAAPTFSPAAGAVAAGTTVTISTTTDGAVIYYTTDGSTPTTSSSVYSSPITIDVAQTIKAYAVKDGCLDSDVATAAYTIAVPAATPTFSLAEGTYTEIKTVTITTATDGATIYYTTDGSTPTTESTEYTGAITVDETMTIKAIAAKDGMANSAVASVTYTINLPDYVTLPFSFDDGKSSLPTGLTSSGLGTDYASSPKLKFDNTDDYLIMKTNETIGTLAFNIKGNSFSGGTFKVQYSVDGSSYSDLASYTTLGDTKEEIFNNVPDNARYIKWIYTLKSSGNVALGGINVQKYVSITPAKTYTTLTSDYALDFTGTTIKAFIVKDNDASDGQITMTEVSKVPANTGLVLKATTPGAAVDVPTLAGDADDVSGNLMKGSATETTEISANGGYILSEGKFHPATAGTLPAGKAYLALSVTAPELVLSFDDDNTEGQTTGIDTIEHSTLNIEHSKVYNLNGQRVSQPTKGLYIVNGKKVIVK